MITKLIFSLIGATLGGIIGYYTNNPKLVLIGIPMLWIGGIFDKEDITSRKLRAKYHKHNY